MNSQLAIIVLLVILVVLVAVNIWLYRHYRRNIKKVTFLFDAIDNGDFSFNFPTEKGFKEDKILHQSLNRIKLFLQHTREEQMEREKYYEQILNAVAYLSFLVVALIWFVFYKTRFGMRLRAAGEHPEACETLGINVYAVRYVCVILSGFLSGLGGAFVTLATVSQFRPAVIVGQGFIAIAAVIFGKFSPGGAFVGCLPSPRRLWPWPCFSPLSPVRWWSSC